MAIDASKTRKSHEVLGADTEVRVEQGLPVGELERIVRDAFSRAAPEGHSFMGLACCAVYATSNALIGNRGDLQLRTFVSLSELSPEAQKLVIGEFAKRIGAHVVGKERSSIDPTYKVQP